MTGRGGTSSGPPEGEGTALPRSTPIAAPVRIPTTIVRVAAAAATASKPPVSDSVRPSGASTRGDGKMNAVREEDVEILGLVDQDD